jgi:hypothetical protein
MAITTSDWVELYDLVTRYSRGLDTRDYDLGSGPINGIPESAKA